MSPMSEMRKQSLLPDVVRSQSDTSYQSLATVMMENKGRRASEWAASVVHSNKSKMPLRPLQINGLDQKEFSSLLYRRLSKVRPSSHTTPESHTTGVSRSYSVKSVKKLAEARQRNRGSSIPTESSHSGGVKVKERTVSNRSLPLPGDESEYQRLRNFSVTSKGVINRGDSFRSKSNFDVPSCMGNSEEENVSKELDFQNQVSPTSPLREDDAKISCTQRTFKVLLIGPQGVGKTSMKKQFMTSDYCAYDSLSEQDIDKSLNVILNSEESQMEFDEQTWLDYSVYYTKPDCPFPDAFVLVYSVTDRRSFSLIKNLLSQLESLVDTKAVILVGNKTDLARLRVVTTDEGRSLAKERGCKFIETSVAINHQVDELLVGTLAQILIKIKMADKIKKKRESQGTNRRSSIYNGSKASGVLKRILRRACLKSKSCDNLHVL